jgi:hypothetical protein
MEPGSPPLYPQSRGAASALPPQTRASHGLEQFFSSIQDQENLSILDFAGASQANISFITALGHRIYSNDIVRTLEEAFGNGGDFVANQSDPQRAAAFLRESLDFPAHSFDGALVWDTLQFLAPPLLQDTVDRLFHIPLYSYRIVEPKVLSLTPRGQRKAAQYFNNRSLEKLFQKFNSVKFFLTRDHLREVIVRR